jgi:hypothetical protein
MAIDEELMQIARKQAKDKAGVLYPLRLLCGGEHRVVHLFLDNS